MKICKTLSVPLFLDNNNPIHTRLVTSRNRISSLLVLLTVKYFWQQDHDVKSITTCKNVLKTGIKGTLHLVILLR